MHYLYLFDEQIAVRPHITLGFQCRDCSHKMSTTIFLDELLKVGLQCSRCLRVLDVSDQIIKKIREFWEQQAFGEPEEAA